MNKDIEYYEFTYKIPKYKIKPPLNFCKYYQTHKDEIIIDLQQENKQLKDRIDKTIEYINNLSNESNIFGHYGMDSRCKNWLLKILGGNENVK